MNLLDLLKQREQSKKQVIEDFLCQNQDVDVDFQDPLTKRTALIEACAQGFKEIVEFLIKKGVNVNKEDKNGFTALAMACQKGDKKIAQILIENGAQINTQEKRKSSSNPLFLACLNNHEHLLEFLIEKGAQVENVQDEYGNSFFNECLTRGFKRCSSIMRNRLIRKMYETFKSQSSDSIREELLESLEFDEKFPILNLDSILAFESIDLKNLPDDLELLRERDQLEYFLSENFNEKYSESLLRYFENLLQVLSAGKKFLYEDFAKLQRKSSLIDLESEPKLSVKTITDLISHGHLIQFISSNEETQEEIFSKAQHLFDQIELAERVIRSKFQLTTELFYAITKKCALIKSIEKSNE